MTDQCRVLVTNLYVNLCKLPSEICNSICKTLPSISSEVRPLAARAAAHLIRISGKTINNIVSKVKADGWQIPSEDAEIDSVDATVETPGRSRDAIMKLLVREAIYNSAHGLADDFFYRRVHDSRLPMSTSEISLFQRSLFVTVSLWLRSSLNSASQRL